MSGGEMKGPGETGRLPRPVSNMDVQRLVDPREHGRFWLALCTSTLAIGLSLVVIAKSDGWFVLSVLLLIVLAAWATVWWGVQVRRARLLGSAIQVTDRTLPQLAALISDQRERLNFSKRVDFYVAEEVDGLIQYTSYFGTKVVIVKGDLVADLDEMPWRAQTQYLIGIVLGHLAARHLRFGPMLIGIGAVSKIGIFNFLLSPYFRATWYSGDNIGLYLCQEPTAGVQLMHRLLVGKSLSRDVNIAGMVEQVQRARRRRLTRLTEIFSNTPHMTSRYLNLLRVFDHEFPEEAAVWRAGLPDSTRSQVKELLVASPYRAVIRRGVWGPASYAVCLAVIVAAFVVLPVPSVTRLSTDLASDSTTIPATDSTTTPASDSTSTPATDSTSTPATDSATTPPSENSTDEFSAFGTPQERLDAMIPSNLAPQCSTGSDGSQLFGSFSGVSQDCHFGTDITPKQVSYYAFTDKTAMNDAFQQLSAGPLPQGACTAAGAESTYGTASAGGEIACYTSKNGQDNDITWTTTEGVLGVLWSTAPMSQLYRDWQSLP